MRIHAQKHTEAFEVHGINLSYVDVKLDGKHLLSKWGHRRQVEELDTEEGWVVAFLLNPQGRPKIDGTSGATEFMRERVYGVVSVELKSVPDGSWPHRIPRPGALPAAP